MTGREYSTIATTGAITVHWIITKDLGFTEGRRSRVGFGYLPFGNQGPDRKLGHAEQVKWLEDYMSTHCSMFPYHFRLKNDDGDVDFEGQCGDIEQADGDAAFAPLDWAEGDTGSTTMEFRKKGSMKWSVL